MVGASVRGRSARAQPIARRTIWTAAATTALVVFVILVIGGYALHWRWTGLSRSVTLWDWLQVLALPIAIASAPLLLRHRRRLTRKHHLTLAAVLTVFVVLAVAGYLVPMAWTGFTGNTLWDWLELVLLPLVVATTSSLWGASWRPGRRHLAVATALLVGFGLLIIGGYLVPLTWTGFTGNTLWDWVKLLLVPVIVPVVLVPLLSERLKQRLEDRTGQDERPDPR